MNRTALVLLFCACSATAIQAQTTTPPSSFTRGAWLLTAELGGAAFTAFQRVRAVPQDAAGLATERRVAASTTATVGASIGYWAGANWGARVGLSWSPSNFTVAHEDDTDAGLIDSADATENYASLAVWGADLSMLFRFPRDFGRVQPYGIVGGGVVRYEHGRDAEVPAEARDMFDGGASTHAAALLGLGAMIPLQRNNLVLSFELTDRLNRSPLAGNARTLNDEGVDLDTTPAREGGDITNQLRLTVGLTLPLR